MVSGEVVRSVKKAGFGASERNMINANAQRCQKCAKTVFLPLTNHLKEVLIHNSNGKEYGCEHHASKAAHPHTILTVDFA